MAARTMMLPPSRVGRSRLAFVVTACLLLVPTAVVAQALTGALIGTVKDAQGGVLPAAEVLSPLRR
jgi:hypothetical protein